MLSNKAVEAIQKDLQQLVSKSRYDHSLRVADTAKQLATRWRVSEGKAFLAGLVHDSAKSLSPAHELLSHFSELQRFTSFYAQFPSVWHAVFGPVWVTYKWGITDEVVLRSIKSHTSGKARMGFLEKIIFVADYCEPGRPFLEKDFVYELAKNDLNEAVFCVAWLGLMHLTEAGLPIFEQSFKCYNYYRFKLSASRVSELIKQLQKVSTHG